MLFFENKHRELPAVCLDGETISYESLNLKVDSLCHKLELQGIKPGDYVPFEAYTSLNSIVFFLSLWRLQAIPCPLNYRLHPKNLEEQTSFLKTLPISDSKMPDLVIFSSGSSGAPKAICLSFENLLESAISCNEALMLSETDNWHLSLPLFHVGGIGILLRVLNAGAALTISDNPIEDKGITHSSLVPTQIKRFLKNNAAPYLKGLKAILLGGAPISSTLFNTCYQMGIPTMPTFGMSETSSLMTLNQKKEGIFHLGKTLPGRDLIISKTQEILVKGKTLFLGYLQTDGSIYKIPGENGYFNTGDLGSLDEAGNLHFLGRKDRMFTSLGENIYPEEIERAILELPNVNQAVVIPIANEEWGFRPYAYIDMEEGYSLPNLETLKDGLPSIKIPYGCEKLLDSHGLKPSYKTLQNKPN